MSNKDLFDIFYAIPNPHFNAYFEATTGPGEKHPLEDLIHPTGVDGPPNTTEPEIACSEDDGEK